MHYHTHGSRRLLTPLLLGNLQSTFGAISSLTVLLKPSILSHCKPLHRCHFNQLIYHVCLFNIVHLRFLNTATAGVRSKWQCHYLCTWWYSIAFKIFWQWRNNSFVFLQLLMLLLSSWYYFEQAEISNPMHLRHVDKTFWIAAASEAIPIHSCVLSLRHGQNPQIYCKTHPLHFQYKLGFFFHKRCSDNPCTDIKSNCCCKLDRLYQFSSQGDLKRGFSIYFSKIIRS